MNNVKHTLFGTVVMATLLTITGCNESDSNDTASSGTNDPAAETGKTFTVVQGVDTNSKASDILSLNPGGPGGSPNQSLRAGDVLTAVYNQDSIVIGGLGVDVLVGDSGDDILIGGTEDFNSNVDGDGNGADNRDRAFGGSGNDAFIWTPGDGSDSFNGGEGTDVLIFGLLGEQRDEDGTTAGAPFFNVSPPSTEGSQDFDGIFLDQYYQPVVDVSNSPGFCSVLDKSTNGTELEALGLDHVVRFSLRGVADDFDAGVRDDDDGLRVAISVKNVEYVVCTRRTILGADDIENVEVLDLTTTPPRVALLSELPEHIAQIIR